MSLRIGELCADRTLEGAKMTATKKLAIQARLPLLVGAFGLALLGCVDPMPPGPTTTASTSSTAYYLVDDQPRLR